jgi:tetratricopeptide (TPR) repeat protein
MSHWRALACSLLVCTACASTKAEQRAQVQRETSATELAKIGDAASAAGDMTRAEQYYVASLKAGGDERRLVRRLLQVCAADRRYPVALEYAEQYLRHHPNDTEVMFVAASLYAATGKREPARSLLETVVKKEPSWPDPHYVLATVLREDGAEASLADEHDLEYLRLSPAGPLAENARARLRKATP